MNVRKLLDWRKLLIYSHRWMGIVGGLLFITWFFSGIMMMYWGMPNFSNAERLSHLAPVDLSTARVEPMDVARNAGIKPSTLKVAMYYDGRPVYRFQGNAAVYADTGEVITTRTASEALELVRSFDPAHAATVRYDELLQDSDQWTLFEGPYSQLPLHRIAVGDPQDTYYYVSQKTGEPVQKTDRMSRFWGFLSAVLHYVYFPPLKRQRDLWNGFIVWGSFAGCVFCVLGLAAGIWRYSPGGRFRQKHKTSHSPYSGWMWWHHYAGLVFGLISFTWLLSGGLSINPYGWFSSTNPTPQQRQAVSGGPVDLENVTIESLRSGIAAVVPSFVPKEVDVLQFRGARYLTASDPNASRDYRMVSLDHPEDGTFKKFDDAVMMDIAREAMPNVAIREATWLTAYDNYYRSPDKSRVLPILRVQYADPQETWLYLDPHHGSITSRQDSITRARRWLYNGLHSFDFPYIYERPWLRDTLMILLSIGGLALSMTTLVPTFRRLRRHWNRIVRRAGRQPVHSAAIPAVESGQKTQ